MRSAAGAPQLSAAAAKAADAAVTDFEKDLVELSARRARRGQLDVISRRQVEETLAGLYTRPRGGLAERVGTAGGFLLGAASGNVLALAGASAPSDLAGSADPALRDRRVRLRRLPVRAQLVSRMAA